MALPANFSFSQYRFNDYLECPRRFELLYLEKRAWPAVPSEPVLEIERQMENGALFHRMLQQYWIGVPVELIERQAAGSELHNWWSAFLNLSFADLPPLRKPEFTLTIPFHGYRLVAKLDLLAVQPCERAVIIDWKTGRLPRHSQLEDRMQTHLYPFILCEAGRHLNQGQPILPDQVEMIYWSACDQRSEHFYYSQAQHESDRRMLMHLIAEIENCQQAGFAQCSDAHICERCQYRSLCDRGQAAGIETEELDWETDLDNFRLDLTDGNQALLA